MPTKPKLSNQPFTPRGAEAGPLPLPAEEEIVAELMADAGTAGEVWDALMPEYAGLLDAGPVLEEYGKPPIDRNAAFAAADNDYFNRCQSRNPRASPWVAEVRAASGLLGMAEIRARCTRPRGHAGAHIGPDDVVWSQGLEEPDA